MPKFTKGTPKPPNSGTRKGSPNKGTESARRLISEADDKAIVDQIVRDAKANNPHALQVYFRYLRPPVSRTTSVWPIDLEPPKSAQEARDAIAKAYFDDRQGRDRRGTWSPRHRRPRGFSERPRAELEALYEMDKVREGET